MPKLRSNYVERHDYDVEVTGGTTAAHYASDYREVEGIELPTKHRIFPPLPTASGSTIP